MKDKDIKYRTDTGSVNRGFVQIFTGHMAALYLSRGIGTYGLANQKRKEVDK